MSIDSHVMTSTRPWSLLNGVNDGAHSVVRPSLTRTASVPAISPSKRPEEVALSFVDLLRRGPGKSTQHRDLSTLRYDDSPLGARRKDGFSPFGVRFSAHTSEEGSPVSVRSLRLDQRRLDPRAERMHGFDRDTHPFAAAPGAAVRPPSLFDGIMPSLGKSHSLRY